MDVDSYVLIGLLLLGIILAVFAAAAEMAFTAVSRFQARHFLGTQRGRAPMTETLLEQPTQLLSTLLVVKFVGFVGAAAAAALLAERLGGHDAVIGWLVLLVLVLIFLQILVRAWIVGRQEQVALRLALPVKLASILLTPATLVMRRFELAVLPRGVAPESIFLSQDGLRLLLDANEEETTIEDEEKEMIASIFEFGETLVREVMVPRIDVAAVQVDMSILEALDVILKAGHSRIPVYKDSVDNIMGILYAKDLLRYLRDGRTDVPLGKLLRPAYYIPESKKVADLLQELQQRRVHMAIVVDEYGGTAGLVTIEDLLEEIVGEIQDEYDAEEATIEAVGDHEFLFDARVPLDEVSKLLEVQLPAEGGDTLGGFIYSQLGKVPAVGDTIQFENVNVEVLSVAGRRIKQVRVGLMSSREDRSSSMPEGSGNGAGPALLAFMGLR